MLPVLYLRGLLTGDFAPALSEFFGSGAGPSSTSIGRLLETWSDEYEAFTQRDLSDSDFVYVWADGVHFRIRLEEDRLCCLVVIGVKADGSIVPLACSDGYRESTESWADVLRDLKNRGMTAPMVAVGDGALGFWAALGDVFPETAEQRCWVHYVESVTMPMRVSRSGVCNGSCLVLSAQSEDFDERKERVGWLVAAGFGAGGGGTGDRSFFDAETGVEVDLGCFDALVSEPEGDDGGVDTGGEEPYGTGVA